MMGFGNHLSLVSNHFNIFTKGIIIKGYINHEHPDNRNKKVQRNTKS